MQGFADIHARAADRKGADQLATMLKDVTVKSPAAIAALGDDRILSEFSKRVFQAGFNWKVVESKWSGFEDAFEGFDITRNVFMSDDDLDAHLRNTAIIRHARKIVSIRENAVFLSDLARAHGSAAKAIGEWPASDQIGLMDMMKKRGARLGGMTGQYALRFLGKETFILSNDVCTALITAGVVDKPPTSKSALRAVQAAFNDWQQESGLDMSRISRTLALSTG